MGFFDKISATVKQIKDENKYFAKTTGRINDNSNFYGNVNRNLKDGDFRQGSYVSIENGQGVIYNTGEEDYIFNAGDIVALKFDGEGKPINRGDSYLTTLFFNATFKDGKKAEMEIIALKVDEFKNKFNLK